MRAQRLERAAQVGARLAGVGHRALPERLADDRGGLQHAALRARQRVEAGREHGVDRLGQRLGLARALLEDPVDHLLGEQRVAARTAGDLDRELLRNAALAQQRADQRAGVLLGERVEGERGRVQAPAAPPGAAVEELVARQAHEQGRPAGPPGQVLDQVEHALVGPVDVLDGEDQRLAPARRLDQRSHAGEQEQVLDHEFPDYRRLVRLPADGASPSMSRRCAPRWKPARSARTRSTSPAASLDLSVLTVTPERSVTVSEDGEEGQVHVGLNRAFLLQALAAGGRDQLLLEFGSPTAPLAIRRTDSEGLRNADAGASGHRRAAGCAARRPPPETVTRCRAVNFTRTGRRSRSALGTCCRKPASEKPAGT